MIDVCAFSDGHGILPKVNPFDLLLIAGDNVLLEVQSSVKGTIDWYTQDFVNWINALPFKDENSKVLFICGNHEVGFEKLNKNPDLGVVISGLTNGRAIYLENQSFTYYTNDGRTILIYGTPQCKIFGRWAYMQPDEKLEETYSNIPKNCDILLTHDAPYGTSDLCYDWSKWGKALEHIGNKPLRNAIIEKTPKYCLHGHLHSSNHEFEYLGVTQVTNVSLVNESYKEAYSPLYLEL